ncbi:MAG: hypothetical protein BAJALOKI2v1_60002 [Promethearchaeota archaeon]|nr:MAG: hypothetical protein BAJALOKI2v1_60002 [Candidatus Lokiarchaeota archaeon]
MRLLNMKNSFLRDIAKQWYQYEGYEIKKTTETGIIAYNPKDKVAVHIETGLKVDYFEEHGKEHKNRFNKAKDFYKAELGLKPSSIKKRSIIEYASQPRTDSIQAFETESGSEFVHIKDFLVEIQDEIKGMDPSNNVIPYKYPILRFFQTILANFNVTPK